MGLREGWQTYLEQRALRNVKKQEIVDPTSEAIKFVRGSSRIIHPDQDQLPDGLDSSRPWRVSKYGNAAWDDRYSKYRVGFPIPREGSGDAAYILRTNSSTRVGIPVAILSGGEKFVPIPGADSSMSNDPYFADNFTRQIEVYYKIYNEIVKNNQEKKEIIRKKRVKIFAASLAIGGTISGMAFGEYSWYKSDRDKDRQIAEQTQVFDNNYQGQGVPLNPTDLASSGWNLAETLEQNVEWIPTVKTKKESNSAPLVVEDYRPGTLRALKLGETCTSIVFGSSGKLNIYSQPGEAPTVWAASPDDGSITVCKIGHSNDDKKEHSVIFEITQ